MGETTITVGVQSGQTLVTFTGPIDENSPLPSLPANTPQPVVIDLNKVTYINSFGIKMWIQWITPLAQSQRLEFVNCPKSIILQINMVKNFLPDNAKVKSFYLPLFSEEADRETSVLIETARDIEEVPGGARVKTPLQSLVASADQGIKWEIDVVEKKYFRFLSKS